MVCSSLCWRAGPAALNLCPKLRPCGASVKRPKDFDGLKCVALDQDDFFMKRIGDFSSRALPQASSQAAPAAARPRSETQDSGPDIALATRPTKLQVIRSQVCGRPRLLLDAIRLHAVKSGKVRPRTPQEYLAHWRAWVDASPSQEEHRSQALTRILQWQDPRFQINTLDLSGLGLTSLPDYLPDAVKILSISCNKLTALPETLPSSIDWLFASDNHLSHLPVRLPQNLELLWVANNHLTSIPGNLPDSIIECGLQSNRLTSLPDKLPENLNVLKLDDNQLSRLPETLPAALLRLSVSDNRLTSLPERLPPNILEIDASCNDLTHLPNCIIDQMVMANVNLVALGGNCIIYNSELDISGNPFPARVINSLHALVQSDHYQGPRIHYSMSTQQGAQEVRALPLAVADWFEAGDREAVTACWAGMDAEAGATDFSKFLDRLQTTIYNRPETDQPMLRSRFRQATAEWLRHLAQNPRLRAQSFLISQEASTTCEDRVSWFLNLMKKARVSADVESGCYDTNLPGLIGLAKGMFRLDQLEVIAREKVASLRFVDEIEVYLAYQVKLRECLQLPLDTPDMRYFDASYVTPEDLDGAHGRVLQAEKDEFIDYLSTDWQPWQSVLKRMDHEAHEEANRRLAEAMGQDFSDRLSSELKKINLENDLDAQCCLGAQLKTAMTREIKAQLTQTFMAKHGLTDLLP